MIKLKDSSALTVSDHIIPMKELKPLQAGVVVSGCSAIGHIVLRTASVVYFEVMDLSQPEEGNCWNTHTIVEVRLLRPGETYTLKIS